MIPVQKKEEVESTREPELKNRDTIKQIYIFSLSLNLILVSGSAKVSHLLLVKCNMNNGVETSLISPTVSEVNLDLCVTYCDC